MTKTKNNKNSKKRTKKWFKIECLFELENSLGNVNGFEVKQLYAYDFDITSACKAQNIARDCVIDYYPAESIKLQRIKKLYNKWR